MSTDESDSRLKVSLQALQRRARSTPTGGTPDESLVRREAALRRPIPKPVRLLFGTLGPDDWARAVSGIELLPLDQTDWVADDEGGSYFAFANGVFGDPVFFCERAPSHGPGTIVLADHESGGTLIVLETDLASWLDRLATFGGHEYAYVNGELASLPPNDARRFLQRHLTLNPGSEWAARALMRLDHPQGHPAGYHHWDATRQRLVPIAEAGDVRHVTITGGTQRDLESVAAAGRCDRLMVCGGAITDLTPLAQLTPLRELYLYDLADIDAAPLASASRLTEICFLRCRVHALYALACAASLRRLRLNQCQFNESELNTVRQSRPGLGISL